MTLQPLLRWGMDKHKQQLSPSSRLTQWLQDEGEKRDDKEEETMMGTMGGTQVSIPENHDERRRQDIQAGMELKRDEIHGWEKYDGKIP